MRPVVLAGALLAACATPESSCRAARNLSSTEHQPANRVPAFSRNQL